MSRRVELFVLLALDFVGLLVAIGVSAAVAVDQGWLVDAPPIWQYVIAVVFWLMLFAFAGLYQEQYPRGRFDELVTLAKVTLFGGIAFVFVYAIGRIEATSIRPLFLLTGALILLVVGAGRSLLHAVRKALVLRGYGLRKALLVGSIDRVEKLSRDLEDYPAAGIHIAGIVHIGRTAVETSEPVLAGSAVAEVPEGDGFPEGTVTIRLPGEEDRPLQQLSTLADNLDVQDVIIALDSEDHATLNGIFRVLDGSPLNLKLVPDFYTAIGGMARTEHTYGLPLIEVLPEPIPAWEKRTKRLMDIIVSVAVLTAGLPLWVLVGMLIRLTSKGPAIYRQKRVGQRGNPFVMLKFRTMLDDAERHSGPVWSHARDRRITPIGAFLRAIRLDEIPQLWNVLKGEMSLVGPRPERPYFVEHHVREIPLYSRRHRVQPGITGLAQVEWGYGASLDDVRRKLKFDLFYIENMSLRLDAKIILRTFRIALLGKGR